MSLEKRNLPHGGAKGRRARQSVSSPVPVPVPQPTPKTAEDVAIVGMACRFPGADNTARFWENLAAGRNSIVEIPPERWDLERYYSPDFSAPNKSITRWCGVVDGEDLFDNRFFNISPREARYMDPQQRLLLEETWHCIEDAGLAPVTLRKDPTAVFVGVMSRDHLQESWAKDVPTDSYAALGGYDCILANRISFFLGLRGPSISIDAACASSLVALHKARQSLLSGECRFAFAAGVSLNLHAFKHISFSKSRMFSPDGQCKTFDKDANGYVPGDGVGVLLLARLGDALALGCHVHGLLKGTAVNHVGHAVSLTAPSMEAQREVILSAYRMAGFSPDTVTYTEAHGTGTSLGDPIEVEALTKVFRASSQDRNFCSIGSVKTNIGHLEASAGVAGVIKLLLMMRHRHIPRTLNIKTLNPLIRFEDSPFAVALVDRPWVPRQADLPLRGGVSSFGFGGVNSHALLEEFRPALATAIKTRRGPQLFLLSAVSEVSLEALLVRWRTFAATPEFERADFADICATMASGREALTLRVGACLADKNALREWLEHAHLAPVRAGEKRYRLIVHTPSDAASASMLQALAALPFSAEPLREILASFGKEAARLPSAKTLAAYAAPKRAYLVVRVLLACLERLGVEPQLMQPVGQALYPALAGATMLADKDALALAEGGSGDGLLPRRPRLSVLDPNSGEIIWPYVFTAKYLRALLACVAPDVADIDYFVTKARLLAQNQFTFKKFLGEWNEALKDYNLTLEDMMDRAASQSDARLNLLLLIAINTSLVRLNRKWNLEPESRIESLEFWELVVLASGEWLSQAQVVEMLVEPSPDLEGMAEALNRLRPQRNLPTDLPLLLEANRELHELGAFNEWLVAALEAEPLSTSGDGALIDLAEYLGPDAFENPLLPLVLDLWRLGLEPDWQQLWPAGSFSRLALPTYPFDRRSFRLPKQ